MNQSGKRTGSNVIGTLGHTFNAISEKPLSSFVSKHLLMLPQRDAGRLIKAPTQAYQQEGDQNNHRANPWGLG
ncbi:hypothetical protein TUM17577_45940 [Enterobacter asburiae]|nr:hypothetical protein TUM17577_45940 [Enterobacter asburiae]